MKAYQTNPDRSGYKLAQLCQASDFNPSTVHYYMKIGLLHRPTRVGLGLYLYDDTHLNRLNKIRALREHENLSLSKIKDRFQKDQEKTPQLDDGFEPFGEKRNQAFLSKARGPQKSEITRERLVDVAAELFSRKGYEATTITDITRSMHMSKGSFYHFFRDKRELFIECIERLAYLIVPEETWEEISREQDYEKRQFRRTIAFLEAFPSYAGILSMAKIAAMGDDPDLASQSKRALGKIVEPILRDFRRAVAKGIVREVDEEFFAYVALGMAENLGYMLMTDPQFDLHEAVEKYVDLISHGVLPVAPPSLRTAPPPKNRSGEITDVKGESVKVREIYFGGQPSLSGRIGEGELQVDTEQIAHILLDHAAPECSMEITMKDGEISHLELDGNMIVSAASSVGLYTIPFRLVRSICFA